MSLRNHIFEYVRFQYPNWVTGVELQRLAQERFFGDKYYSGESASRAARTLKALEKKKKDGLIMYRYIPQKYGVLDDWGKNKAWKQNTLKL